MIKIDSDGHHYREFTIDEISLNNILKYYNTKNLHEGMKHIFGIYSIDFSTRLRTGDIKLRFACFLRGELNHKCDEGCTFLINNNISTFLRPLRLKSDCQEKPFISILKKPYRNFIIR